MCHSNGSSIHKKSQDMVPIFYKITLDIGQFLQNFQILKNEHIFGENPLKWVSLSAKMTPMKHGSYIIKN